MKAIKQRKWLIKNERMVEMNPKEYYREMFNEIVHEINTNRITIEN